MSASDSAVPGADKKSRNPKDAAYETTEPIDTSPIQQEYTMHIGARPKLYDLNRNFTNFEIEFSIDAETPDSVFHVHIMPQEQLEKTDLDTLQMKQVTGKISGKVSNHNNIYQNYFLILRNSDTQPDETRVVIRTITRPFPVTAQPDPISSVVGDIPAPSPMTLTDPVHAETSPGIFSKLSTALRSTRAKQILLLVLVIAVAYIVWTRRQAWLKGKPVEASTESTGFTDETYGAHNDDDNGEEGSEADEYGLFDASAEQASPPSPTSSRGSENSSASTKRARNAINGYFN